MARGLERHRQRQEALTALGRALARRAKSRCELCEQSGISLKAWEVPSSNETVEIERCVLICGACLEGLTNKKIKDDNRWSFLNSAVWSDLAPVQVCAVRLLKKIGAEQTWARDILDTVYLDPEVEAWVEKDS